MIEPWSSQGLVMDGHISDMVPFAYNFLTNKSPGKERKET